MNKKNIMLVSLVVTILIISIVYFYNTNDKKEIVLPNSDTICIEGSGCALTDDITFGYEVGNTIPNIKLKDFDGNTVKLYDLLEGKEKFILNLAVNWCSDCVRQEDKLQKYYSTLPDTKDVAVVYINFSIDDNPKMQASEELAREKINSKGYVFPTYFDYDNELLDAIKPTRVPVNFVIDSKGEIKAHTQEIDMDILLQDNKSTYDTTINE